MQQDYMEQDRPDSNQDTAGRCGVRRGQRGRIAGGEHVVVVQFESLILRSFFYDPDSVLAEIFSRNFLHLLLGLLLGVGGL
jgi:hypothetical protein